MLSVDEAISAILNHCRPLRPRSTPLIDALGLILAEPIVADIELPPFDKALVDGYAVRSIDLGEPSAFRLEVVDEIPAGRMPTRSLGPGEVARIMTGAPLPLGADAVVMVEKSRLEGSTVILHGPVAPGQNRLIQGREMKASENLLPEGTLLDPTKLGLIASAGRAEVLANPRPRISIVPTGDELVSPGQKPAPGQIRNSNGVMLASLARAWGAADVVEHAIAPDDPVRLAEALQIAVDPTDLTIVCGGVSAGNRDLVPGCLMGLGVSPVFHQVNVKPGKPIWFGVRTRAEDQTRTIVFGLPGNPVSGVVSFLLFVKPALEALAGHLPKRTQLASFRLGQPFRQKGDRPTFHPARLDNGFVFPLDWAGSADLRTVALADGFVAFPAGDRRFEVGEALPFLVK